MLCALRSFVFPRFVVLSLLAWEGRTIQAGEPTWGKLQSGGPSNSSVVNQVYYYNNAAFTSVAPIGPSSPAPPTAAAPLTSVTYRSYSPDPGSNSGSYYYTAGPCGCYYYAPGPTPAVAQSPPSSATAPPATAANANSGTYRSFSPDPGTSTNYTYAPGTYSFPASHSGHSWGGRR